MTYLWYVFSIPPYTVSEYYKFGFSILHHFYISISPSTNLDSTTTVSSPGLRSGLLAGRLSGFPFSSFPHYSHSDLSPQKAKLIMSTRSPSPAFWMASHGLEDTGSPLHVTSEACLEPFHLPSSSHTTVALALCDLLHPPGIFLPLKWPYSISAQGLGAHSFLLPAFFPWLHL